MIRGGQEYQFVKDHLGSVKLVVRVSDGVVMQNITYDEFGRVLSDSNPGFQPFGFAGGVYDAQTGLTKFGVRDYDAEVGRWLTKDPILFHGGDANLYGYVMMDPVNWVDPKGEVVWPLATAAVGATVGFVTGWLSAPEECKVQYALRGAVIGGVTGLLGGFGYSGAGGVLAAASRLAGYGGALTGSAISGMAAVADMLPPLCKCN